ncbi:MAG TPA: NUDIX domain-containing protein [Acidobacteriota bacterium]|nr:NUDIX domain-containing protein [Acidobacteriota bacterium]
MRSRVSAGLLMYRFRDGELQVFLAHPGGPLYQKKDEGYWTIPKGEPPAGEDLHDAAVREFEEETGIKPHGPYLELGSIVQKGGKVVYGWAFAGDHDPSQPVRSNLFEMQWPPGSGRIQSFPEVDRAQFFPLCEGKKKLKNTQWPLVERLAARLEFPVTKD